MGIQKIEGKHIDHILVDDGKIYVKMKEGTKAEDVAEEVKLRVEPECKTADDCQKKYGDPPFGTEWVCMWGRCYFG